MILNVDSRQFILCFGSIASASLCIVDNASPIKCRCSAHVSPFARNGILKFGPDFTARRISPANATFPYSTRCRKTTATAVELNHWMRAAENCNGKYPQCKPLPVRTTWSPRGQHDCVRHHIELCIRQSGHRSAKQHWLEPDSGLQRESGHRRPHTDHRRYCHAVKFTPEHRRSKPSIASSHSGSPGHFVDCRGGGSGIIGVLWCLVAFCCLWPRLGTRAGEVPVGSPDRFGNRLGGGRSFAS